MNDCQKIGKSYFYLLGYYCTGIFLTGCHTVQWEWFPKSEQKPK